eukprot:31411-Pelagococcus_subviridis.AAC.10
MDNYPQIRPKRGRETRRLRRRAPRARGEPRRAAGAAGRARGGGVAVRVRVARALRDVAVARGGSGRGEGADEARSYLFTPVPVRPRRRGERRSLRTFSPGDRSSSSLSAHHPSLSIPTHRD